MKKTIRLTESELKKLIKESVKRVLKENYPDDDDYLMRKVYEIEEYVYSLDEDDAFQYILDNRQTGLEIELSCGIHFGMGLYAWAKLAKYYLPQNMIHPLSNKLFVSLEDPNILRTYIKNSFRKNGGLIN